jgi:hypothetical protein
MSMPLDSIVIGFNLTNIPLDGRFDADQAILDVDQVRILSMSHKYDPSRVHVGLMIYSVDGQTDFILNDAMLRIKSGDLLIHQTHHALTGQEELYRDLIRTLFGTHRINLIGLVFTFTGSGQFSDCMRWKPTGPLHTTPMHPTEQKLLEIALVSLYMNHAWLSMSIASHVDIETLSQSSKKQYLLKLADIEQQFNKRRQEQKRDAYLPLKNFLKFHSHDSSDSFRSFEWTPARQETFDSTVKALLDEFYSIIEQTFSDGEFDRDQYAYYDDSTRQLMTNLVSPYQQLQNESIRNIYSVLPRSY